MRTYKVIKDEIYGTTVIEFVEGDKIGWIPTDPANSDYQAYLNKDKAEQSTPMVTDEATTL
jgi:hypothetical protein